ncbi:MAG: hypothetical protein CMJ54_00880, partial [Planctomycetaceae bacterium]|nr:hypothetical protein [Planctomycetaceae bacterium]
TDGDGTPDCLDNCPADPNKTEPGACGCGVADTDTDGDGTPDCLDSCPADPNKTEPGACGCGVADTDTDGDGTPDCLDSCPEDPNKTEPGACGCGESDADSDGDGIADCNDACPNWPYDCSDDGTTFNVEPGQSVQAAMSAVPDGGVVRLASGVYTQTIDFEGRQITVEGDPADPSAVVFDGTGSTEAVVRFTSGEDQKSILRGVTIRNGVSGSTVPGTTTRAGGGIFVVEASPRIESCLVTMNNATLGGGVYVQGGAPTLSFSTFTFNESVAYGGAMYLDDSLAMIDSCGFAGNLGGSSGGAVHARDGSVLILESVFESNEAFQPGGAISWQTDGTGMLIVEGSTIRENVSLTAGGGVATLFMSDPAIELRTTEICDNAPDDIFGGFVDGGGNSMCDCVGDLTGDGFVTGADLGLLLGAWGPCPAEGDCVADINGDGEVSGADLGLLLGAWGECMSP